MKIFDIMLAICLGIIIVLLYIVLFYAIIIASEHRLAIELYIIEFLYMLFITYKYIRLLDI